MLSDHCLSVCLSCLSQSVTLAYCDPTVRWIKMKLGIEVASAPATLCYMGTSSPSKRGTAPNFRLMSDVAKQLDGLRYHLVRR